jgi:DNA topoisomerase-1
MKNLVIVESPAKAKTIEGFLGKGYTVRSSFGHIRDLEDKDLSVDVANGYRPNYVVPADKKKLVDELKKISNEADLVWLASDEDREGEAISWHLFETLGLKEENTRRIVFHEITKGAITRAIENPRQIDRNLVNAQQARRVLDRLVGYELSPILWKKVKPSLSAGRVQSVAVRLIVEREREVDSFKATSQFRVVAILTPQKGGRAFKAELPQRFATESEATEFLRSCIGAEFSVNDIQTRPSKRTPAPPFTTSTLQQEASRKLSMSVARTMKLAQDLYEQGKITYMRTDSVNLSELALNTAREAIIALYGEKYSQTRQYTSKAKGAQEAHEAIRPTYMNVQEIEGTPAHQKLYELIWKRTLASQMSDALIEKTTADITISSNGAVLQANGEVIRFEGFLKVYTEGKDDEENEEGGSQLPAMTVGERLGLERIDATERFSQAPYRYTEASLVRKLEELGIGRPSTYAPTISTIINRNYVVKEDKTGTERSFRTVALKDGKLSHETKKETVGTEKSKLFPTDIGGVVTDFLVANFSDILDYNFTAQVEKEFDEIAQGKLEWVGMIDSFYKPFHSNAENTLKTSEKVKGERLLGKDPASGRNLYARIGRFGPMIQIGDVEEEAKPLFASMRKDQRIETITIDEALDLFKLPREIGIHEGEKLVVNVGRFGPYVKFGKEFVSIGKVDPMTITLEEAVGLIISNKERKEKLVIHEFQDGSELIRVLQGRFGPYIASNGNNYKIPKGTEPGGLTLEDCRKLMEAGPTGGAKKGGFKRGKR